MYAADGYELRKDWLGDGKTKGRHVRLATAVHAPGVLKAVASTDLLQAVSLFSTREKRELALSAGKTAKEVPGINANRQALLDLPLDDYTRFVDRVAAGFVRAAKFLHRLHIYHAYDLPYQSQLVPLAAILAELGDAVDHAEPERPLEKENYLADRLLSDQMTRSPPSKITTSLN